jgi:hypothetical protein
VAHQAGNAEELARVLVGHLAGEPVEIRGVDRQIPFRAMNDADLWHALVDRMAVLGKAGEVVEAGEAVPDDTDVRWTGRTMKVPQFGEHMREELVLHGWDITGDDPAAQARLSEAWMTDHNVFARHRLEIITRPYGSGGTAAEHPHPLVAPTIGNTKGPSTPIDQSRVEPVAWRSISRT